VGLIKEAKLIVCPYIDATQSGVLMTAFALHKPVIASSVGAFAEHIKNDVNGLLVKPSNSNELAKSIIYALQNNHYLHLEQNLLNDNQANQWHKNSLLLMEAYNEKNIS
jgi:glycosyltransferase involved in cell wall biosynthesis